MEDSLKITGNIKSDLAKLLRLRDAWQALSKDHSQVSVFAVKVLNKLMVGSAEDLKEYEQEFLRCYQR